MSLQAIRRVSAPLGVELWRIDLGGEPHDAQWRVLSAEEQARAARFAFARDRGRYVHAHAALREVLAVCTGIEAARLRFELGQGDKPMLAGGSGPSFNLAHSGELALVVVSQEHEVGVDVEAMRPVDDAAELAALHYTEAERNQLDAAAARDRDAAFLAIWTRKEACLKAIGSGLRIEPGRVDCADGAGGEVRLAMAQGVVRLQVKSVDCGADAVAAIARVRARA
jgi:4'-phosphopantetheinyl transferase